MQPIDHEQDGICRRTALDGGSHGMLGVRARFEAGKRIESGGNTACRVPRSLRNFQLLAKLGQHLTHLHMPVVCFFAQPLLAFQHPETEHADAVDRGSFLRRQDGIVL